MIKLDFVQNLTTKPEMSTRFWSKGKFEYLKENMIFVLDFVEVSWKPRVDLNFNPKFKRHLEIGLDFYQKFKRNLKFALHLFKTQIKPGNWSRHCWKFKKVLKFVQNS